MVNPSPISHLPSSKSDIVIKAENIGKMYTIGHQAERGGYTALRDVLMQNARTIWNKTKDLAKGKAIIQGDTMEEVWALKDVSFEIKRGEVVGIIGRNGAGKSTLLKVLSRITEPSTGRVTIKGRVASLLEVGTGFHPELSGRENIYMNGTILGMTRAEIKRKFDEIVAFAEVEKYLDTPVKRYSSGMYVRLAFAVAAHLEPEILVVDEVLAVGDLEFQKKCLGRMRDVSNEGRTVLFVSHNMPSIRTLCNKGILLEQGKISFKGSIDQAVNQYTQDGLTPTCKYQFINSALSDSNSKADLLEVCIKNSKGIPCASIMIDQSFSIYFALQLNISVPFLRAGIDIVDSMGTTVLETIDTDSVSLHGVPRFPGVFRETVFIPGFLLMPGIYSVHVFAGIPKRKRIMEHERVVQFEIIENNSHLSHLTNVPRSGYISMPMKWSVNHESF